MRQSIWRDSATETPEVLSAISRANARAAGNNSSGAYTVRTRPPDAASSADRMRPVYTHSAAREMPTTRGKNHDEQASGTMPRRVKTKPMRAADDANRTSMGNVIVAPMPTAAPLIAAMTGFLHANIRSVT